MKTAPLILAVLALASCGGAGPAVRQATPTGPDAATVSQWPAKWCGDVHAGQDRADIVATMGTPTETYADQDQWDGFGYHFTAFYDENGTARQLDVNDIAMSAAQKAKIACDASRS